MFNILKSRPHTSDLQIKAFQGHYLEKKELVELQNISLIDIVNFVRYDYRNYMVNNIVILQVPYVWDSDIEKPWFGGQWYEDVT